MANYEGFGQTTSDAINNAAKFFDELIKQVDIILIDKIQEYYQYVANAVLPIISGLVLCWIVYRGIQMMIQPNPSQSLSQFMIQVLKILVIVTFAFSWGYFGSDLTDVVVNGMPALINKMTNTNSDTLILSFADKLMVAFKQTLSNFQLGNWVASAFAVVIVVIIMFIAAVSVVVSYFYIVLKSKFTIAILLVLTPLALTCLMFERTRGYVMNWINALVLPLLTLLLINLIVGLMGGVVVNVLTQFMIDGELLPNNVSGAFMAIIVAAIMFKMIQEAPNMASNLVSSGFGMATSDMSFNPLNKYRQRKQAQNASKNETIRHNQLLKALGSVNKQ